MPLALLPPPASWPWERLDDWLLASLHAAIYLVGAALLSYLLGKFIRRLQTVSSDLIAERGGPDSKELAKQSTTFADLLRRALFFLIWLLAVILALQEFHLNVGPILAGAGVAGLAVGLAAQSILKDWIAGFFLLTEGRLRIHDVVKIGDLSGTVEQLSLRTTTLRAYDGALHVFPNGSIQAFSNLTFGHAYAVFEVAVDYDDDPARLIALFEETARELRSEAAFSPLILADLDLAGVDRFTEQGVVVKARLQTLAGEQWKVAREFLRRLRLCCVAQHITIATAQRVVEERKVRP